MLWRAIINSIPGIALVVAALALDHITPGDNIIHAMIVVLCIYLASAIDLSSRRIP